MPEGTFQSTLPVRGATNAYAARDLDGHISIHAPREGSDYSRQWANRCMLISIHAPREGSDSNPFRRGGLNINFNPRSP